MPPATAKPVILFLHGLGCYGLYYQAFFDALATHGYRVVAPALRGFGINPQQPGDIAHYQVWLDDIDQVVDETKRSHPHEPITLMGESFGAMLALLLAQRHCFDGIVICAPVLKRRIPARWSEIWSFAWGLCNRPDRPSVYTGGRERWGSRNNDFIRRSNQDPRFIKTFSPRLLWQLQRLTWAARRVRSLTMPLLFIQGEQDYITDPAYNGRFFNRLSCPQKEFLSIPRAMHCLFFDAEALPIIQEKMSRWLPMIQIQS